jgi:hypothetical protein
MNDLHANWFQELLADHQPPCVSIYMPTNRAHPPADEDPIKFRDHIDEAQTSLLKNFDRRQVEPVIGKLRAYVSNPDFWTGAPRDGLAFFASADYVQAVDLQQNVGDLVVVGDSFHVKPLIRVLQSGDRYQVLCLSEKNVTMYEGSRYGLRPLELRNVPTNVYQVSGMRLGKAVDSATDLAEAEKQASAGPGAELAPAGYDHFMRAVDKAVWENYSRPSKLPLILCAVEEWHPQFQNISKNPYLVKEGIKLSPVHLPMERLREEAWRIMEPGFRANLDRVTNDFRAAKAHHKGSDEVIQVAEAAAAGRVGTLLVQENQHIPGKVLRSSGQIAPPERTKDHAEDVLDDLAEMVLRTDGQVLVLPPDIMPTDTGVAAIYRY